MLGIPCRSTCHCAESGEHQPCPERSGLAEGAPRRVWGVNPALGHLLCAQDGCKASLQHPEPAPRGSVHGGAGIGRVRSWGDPAGSSQNLPSTICREPERGFCEKRPSSLSGTLPSPPSLADPGQIPGIGDEELRVSSRDRDAEPQQENPTEGRETQEWNSQEGHGDLQTPVGQEGPGWGSCQ